MLLHEERARLLGIHSNVMNAVSDLRVRIRNVLRAQAAIDGLPGFASVIRAECAGCGNSDPNSFWIAGIENDGVQAHSAGARLPLGTGAVAAQSGEFVPARAAVGGAEDGGVFDSGVNRVRIGERWLKMPDAFELPGMGLAIIKLVRGHGCAGFGRGVVDKFVALTFGL